MGMESEISIEYLLGSKNKIKLLRILIKNKEAPMSLLRKNVNMKYGALKRFLQDLVNAGILQEFDLGFTKIYKTNFEDKRIKALKELFGL